MPTPAPPAPRFRRRWLLAGAAALLGLWLVFVDSHSLARRIRWHHELTTLRAENARLEQHIQELEESIEAAGSDEVVERIAREQHGMRRPGETVYPVESGPTP